MKQSKWDIFLGGLFYALPYWIMLIPIVVDNFNANTPISDMSILAFAVMIAYLCSGMDLKRVQYLEDEVEKLKKKLDENK